MADWRSKLTFSDRFENVQKIASAAPEVNAASLETDAYNSSNSHDEYTASCLSLCAASKSTDPAASQVTPESPGITIGNYQNCHFIASGATSAVYRSDVVALKVIVETHNIEPHDPARETKILASLKEPCIVPLIETFRDQDQNLVLALPFMPVSLDQLLESKSLTIVQIRSHFRDLFSALASLHGQGILHRDIKPSAVLLKSPDGPAYLSDFGTAWHPSLSVFTEPPDSKVLDIGTGAYRAPEVLFGNKSYGPSVDLWGAGAMLAEACRGDGTSLFESRPVHEDGNQLSLILSIFQTIGSPTRESWPEAANFKTPPFDMYRSFEGRTWAELLPGVGPEFRELIIGLVQYDSGSRPSAAKALHFACLQDEKPT